MQNRIWHIDELDSLQSKSNTLQLSDLRHKKKETNKDLFRQDSQG